MRARKAEKTGNSASSDTVRRVLPEPSAARSANDPDLHPAPFSPSPTGAARVLTGRQRQFLRGLGHHLDPVVQIGKEGITDGLLAALERALDQHELIKLRIGEHAPGERPDLAAAIAQRTGSGLVQLLGRTCLIYRRRPDSAHDKRPHLSLPREPSPSTR